MKSLLQSIIKGNAKITHVQHRHCKALHYFRIAVFGSAFLVFILSSIFLFQQWRERRRRGLPKEYSTDARAQIKKGSYDRAVELYEKKLAVAPSDPEAHNMLGVLHAEQGNTTASIKSFQNALKMGIAPATAHQNLGNVYLSKNDVDSAVRHFEKAAMLREDYLPPRVMLARLYDSTGRREDTLRMYEEIFNIEEEHQRNVLRNSTLRMERRKEYKNLFDVKNAYNSGFICEKEGRYDRAVEKYSYVINRQPAFAPAYFRRGIAYIYLADYAKAEEDLKHALKLDPKTTIMESALGDVLYKQGRLDEARKIFQSLSRAFPANIFLKDYLGGILVTEGKYTEAEEVYTALLELKPECSRAHEGLGNVYFNINRYGEAERCYKKAIALAPDAPDPYYNLACLYCRAGENKESMEWLTEALKHGFEDTDFIKKDPNLRALREDRIFSRIHL